ncbi:MAG: TIR domain-containing protein [Anaerolineaceae bacterium]|nr:TIR domain-containing protein [Anaerolineaceae bacterium]
MNRMTNTNKRSHLFVSYSRSDRIAVDKLVADLRQRGYVLWMDVDERGIEPGEDWQQELTKQMSDSEGVIACISPDFLASPYCPLEIAQAQRENKPIYPAIVRRLSDDHGLSAIGLDHVQYTDLALNYESGLRKLLVALPSPQSPYRKWVRNGSIITAVIALIILIFGGISLAVRQGITSVQPTATSLPPTATAALQNYDVSVVLSYFVVDTPDKVSQADADAVIERFAKSLDQQLSSELSGSKLKLSYKMDGPAGVTRITGKDAQSRQQAAISLLNDRAAKVAIYGVIHYDAATQQTLLQPEFYVSADRYFNDAQELTGNYKFGKEIPADSLDDRGKLGTHVTALSYIMTGLFEHMTQQFDSALESYQAALNTPDWKDKDGKDIVYLLIGNSEMKLAEQAARQCDRSTVLAQADNAESAYNESKDIAPDFARTYAGLANVYAVRAFWLAEGNDQCAGKKIDIPALHQAEQFVQQYEAKADATLSEEDKGVQRKLLLTEVQVHFLLWAVQDKAARSDDNNSEYQALLKAVNKIVANYSSYSDSTWASPVMEAYIFRGQALYARGQLRDALDDYTQALAVYNNIASDRSITTQLIAPERAMTVYGYMGDAYFQLRDYVEAGKQYGQAITIAKAGNNSAALSSYQDRQQKADTLARATPTTPAPTLEVTPEATEAST